MRAEAVIRGARPRSRPPGGSRVAAVAGVVVACLVLQVPAAAQMPPDGPGSPDPGPPTGAAAPEPPPSPPDTGGQQPPPSPEEPTTTGSVADAPQGPTTGGGEADGATADPVAEDPAVEDPAVEDPAAHGDAPAPEPPDVEITVPQPSEPARTPAHIVRRHLGRARREVADTGEAHRAVLERISRIEARIQAERSRSAALAAEVRSVTERLAEARRRLAGQARWAYIHGPSAPLGGVLEVDDPNRAVVRIELLDRVLTGDAAEVAELERRADRLRDELTVAAAAVRTLEVSRAAALAELKRRAEDLERARMVLEAFERGSDIMIPGFVFPVGEPYSFVDTFGAPRMPGTPYEHFHQGTDIFAPYGTEVYAVERGVVARVGTDVLGGIKLWLVGESGTWYYYAHLSGYAPGIVDGLTVNAGDVLGYVGDTGNARGTPPHLHFEIRPERTTPVNPAPLLEVVSAWERSRRAGGDRVGGAPPADTG